MKKIYQRPETKMYAIANNDMILKNSTHLTIDGEDANLGYGGRDEDGEKDPLAKEENPFQFDWEED